MKFQLLFLLSLLFIFSSYNSSAQNDQPLPQSAPDLPPAEEEIFKVVEEMPRFPGCEDIDESSKEIEDCAKKKLMKYVNDNINFPLNSLDKAMELAVVQFVVWKDGTIRKIKVTRDPGNGMGEEAARIVESMKSMNLNWRPGQQKGKPACVQYTLPIKFVNPNPPSKRKRSMYDDDGYVYLDNLDEEPLFPDCERYKNSDCTTESLLEFIKENQIYPESALENNIQGIVNVSFIIEKDGSLSNIKAKRKVNIELENHAVEIFKWMNAEDMKWTPGKKNNRVVRTLYNFDVAYDIEEWNDRN